MKKFLFVASLLGLWLWLSPVEAQTKRKVVFGVPVTPPNVVHIPPYIAKDMGFFGEQGIEVEIVTFEGGV
ncbi:MAG TPA: ABC transporter substrate-binding protein, partial [Candidatus Binatia bacterium]|nr:ABC transporter substrate-binding protein [Candidatus Binatia bacterium]